MASRPPVELTIEGEGLRALQRKIKALPNSRELMRELNKGLREGAKHLPTEARSAAAAELPQSGGLAASVASGKFSLRVLNGARTSGVSVTAKGPKGKVRDIRSTDRGRLRHPVFADSAKTRREWTWVNQAIKPRWFTDRMNREAPKVRPDLLAAMERVARKVTGA